MYPVRAASHHLVKRLIKPFRSYQIFLPDAALTGATAGRAAADRVLYSGIVNEVYILLCQTYATA